VIFVHYHIIPNLIFFFDLTVLTGYYTFVECPGMISPTIGVEIGETYTFVQEDISNWMHPMGFAYFPDGAHDGKDELEPNVTQTGSTCTEDFSCPSPRYFRGDEFLGVEGSDDFGLGKSSFFWSGWPVYCILILSYNNIVYFRCLRTGILQSDSGMVGSRCLLYSVDL